MYDYLGPIGGITDMLDAISERQKITSNNIANAHTPGYTAKQTSFAELLGRADSPFETSLSQKMGAIHIDEAVGGDPVNLQKELIEMQKNSLFYSMATRRISSVFTALKSATQVGK